MVWGQRVENNSKSSEIFGGREWVCLYEYIEVTDLFPTKEASHILFNMFSELITITTIVQKSLAELCMYFGLGPTLI